MSAGKNKQSKVGSRRLVNLNSVAAQKLLYDIKQTNYDENFTDKYWRTNETFMVENDNLVQKYQDYISDQQKMGRSEDMFKETYLFTYETEKSSTEICHDGQRVCLKRRHVLGHTGSGVHLVKHYDILTRYMAHQNTTSPVYVMVYKVYLGKKKPIVPRLHKDDNYVMPAFGFDCHISARKVDPKMPICEALNCSYVYIYEHDEISSNTVKHPRQILPYAILNLEKKLPVMLEMPILAVAINSSDLNWEVKGETRRGFRFLYTKPKTKTKDDDVVESTACQTKKLKEQLIEMRTKSAVAPPPMLQKVSDNCTKDTEVKTPPKLSCMSNGPTTNDAEIDYIDRDSVNQITRIRLEKFNGIDIKKIKCTFEQSKQLLSLRPLVKVKRLQTYLETEKRERKKRGRRRKHALDKGVDVHSININPSCSNKSSETIVVGNKEMCVSESVALHEKDTAIQSHSINKLGMNSRKETNLVTQETIDEENAFPANIPSVVSELKSELCQSTQQGNDGTPTKEKKVGKVLHNKTTKRTKPKQSQVISNVTSKHTQGLVSKEPMRQSNVDKALANSKDGNQDKETKSEVRNVTSKQTQGHISTESMPPNCVNKAIDNSTNGSQVKETKSVPCSKISSPVPAIVAPQLLDKVPSVISANTQEDLLNKYEDLFGFEELLTAKYGNNISKRQVPNHISVKANNKVCNKLQSNNITRETSATNSVRSPYRYALSGYAPKDNDKLELRVSKNKLTNSQGPQTYVESTFRNQCSQKQIPAFQFVINRPKTDTNLERKNVVEIDNERNKSGQKTSEDLSKPQAMSNERRATTQCTGSSSTNKFMSRTEHKVEITVAHTKEKSVRSEESQKRDKDSQNASDKILVIQYKVNANANKGNCAERGLYSDKTVKLGDNTDDQTNSGNKINKHLSPVTNSTSVCNMILCEKSGSLLNVCESSTQSNSSNDMNNTKSKAESTKKREINSSKGDVTRTTHHQTTELRKSNLNIQSKGTAEKKGIQYLDDDNKCKRKGDQITELGRDNKTNTRGSLDILKGGSRDGKSEQIKASGVALGKNNLGTNTPYHPAKISKGKIVKTVSSEKSDINKFDHCQSSKESTDNKKVPSNLAKPSANPSIHIKGLDTHQSQETHSKIESESNGTMKASGKEQNSDKVANPQCTSLTVTTQSITGNMTDRDATDIERLQSAKKLISPNNITIKSPKSLFTDEVEIIQRLVKSTKDSKVVPAKPGDPIQSKELNQDNTINDNNHPKTESERGDTIKTQHDAKEKAKACENPNTRDRKLRTRTNQANVNESDTNLSQETNSKIQVKCRETPKPGAQQQTNDKFSNSQNSSLKSPIPTNTAVMTDIDAKDIDRLQNVNTPSPSNSVISKLPKSNITEEVENIERLVKSTKDSKVVPAKSRGSTQIQESNKTERESGDTIKTQHEAKQSENVDTSQVNNKKQNCDTFVHLQNTSLKVATPSITTKMTDIDKKEIGQQQSVQNSSTLSSAINNPKSNFKEEVENIQRLVESTKDFKVVSAKSRDSVQIQELNKNISMNNENLPKLESEKVDTTTTQHDSIDQAKISEIPKATDGKKEISTNQELVKEPDTQLSKETNTKIQNHNRETSTVSSQQRNIDKVADLPCVSLKVASPAITTNMTDNDVKDIGRLLSVNILRPSNSVSNKSSISIVKDEVENTQSLVECSKTLPINIRDSLQHKELNQGCSVSNENVLKTDTEEGDTIKTQRDAIDQAKMPETPNVKLGSSNDHKMLKMRENGKLYNKDRVPSDACKDVKKKQDTTTLPSIGQSNEKQSYPNKDQVTFDKTTLSSTKQHPVHEVKTTITDISRPVVEQSVVAKKENKDTTSKSNDKPKDVKMTTEALKTVPDTQTNPSDRTNHVLKNPVTVIDDTKTQEKPLIDRDVANRLRSFLSTKVAALPLHTRQQILDGWEKRLSKQSHPLNRNEPSVKTNQHIVEKDKNGKLDKSIEFENKEKQLTDEKRINETSAIDTVSVTSNTFPKTNTQSSNGNNMKMSTVKDKEDVQSNHRFMGDKKQCSSETSKTDVTVTSCKYILVKTESSPNRMIPQLPTLIGDKSMERSRTGISDEINCKSTDNNLRPNSALTSEHELPTGHPTENPSAKNDHTDTTRTMISCSAFIKQEPIDDIFNENHSYIEKNQEHTSQVENYERNENRGTEAQRLLSVNVKQEVFETNFPMLSEKTDPSKEVPPMATETTHVESSETSSNIGNKLTHTPHVEHNGRNEKSCIGAQSFIDVNVKQEVFETNFTVQSETTKHNKDVAPIITEATPVESSEPSSHIEINREHTSQVEHNERNEKSCIEAQSFRPVNVKQEAFETNFTVQSEISQHNKEVSPLIIETTQVEYSDSLSSIQNNPEQRSQVENNKRNIKGGTEAQRVSSANLKQESSEVNVQLQLQNTECNKEILPKETDTTQVASSEPLTLGSKPSTNEKGNTQLVQTLTELAAVLQKISSKSKAEIENRKRELFVAGKDNTQGLVKTKQTSGNEHISRIGTNNKSPSGKGDCSSLHLEPTGVQVNSYHQRHIQSDSGTVVEKDDLPELFDFDGEADITNIEQFGLPDNENLKSKQKRTRRPKINSASKTKLRALLHQALTKNPNTDQLQQGSSGATSEKLQTPTKSGIIEKHERAFAPFKIQKAGLLNRGFKQRKNMFDLKINSSKRPSYNILLTPGADKQQQSSTPLEATQYKEHLKQNVPQCFDEAECNSSDTVACNSEWPNQQEPIRKGKCDELKSVKSKGLEASLEKTDKENRLERPEDPPTLSSSAMSETQETYKTDTGTKRNSTDKGNESIGTTLTAQQRDQTSKSTSLKKNKVKPRTTRKGTKPSTSTDNTPILPFNKVMELKKLQFIRFKKGFARTPFINYKEVKRRLGHETSKSKDEKNERCKSSTSSDRPCQRSRSRSRSSHNSSTKERSTGKRKHSDNYKTDSSFTVEEPIKRQKFMSKRSEDTVLIEDFDLPLNSIRSNQPYKFSFHNKRFQPLSGGFRKSGTGFFSWKRKYNNKRDFIKERFQSSERPPDVHSPGYHNVAQNPFNSQMESCFRDFNRAFSGNTDSNFDEAKMATFFKYMAEKMDVLHKKRQASIYDHSTRGHMNRSVLPRQAYTFRDQLRQERLFSDHIQEKQEELFPDTIPKRHTENMEDLLRQHLNQHYDNMTIKIRESLMQELTESLVSNLKPGLQNIFETTPLFGRPSGGQNLSGKIQNDERIPMAGPSNIDMYQTQENRRESIEDIDDSISGDQLPPRYDNDRRQADSYHRDDDSNRRRNDRHQHQNYTPRSRYNAGNDRDKYGRHSLDTLHRDKHRSRDDFVKNVPKHRYCRDDENRSRFKNRSFEFSREIDDIEHDAIVENVAQGIRTIRGFDEGTDRRKPDNRDRARRHDSPDRRISSHPRSSSNSSDNYRDSDYRKDQLRHKYDDVHRDDSEFDARRYSSFDRHSDDIDRHGQKKVSFEYFRGRGRFRGRFNFRSPRGSRASFHNSNRPYHKSYHSKYDRYQDYRKHDKDYRNNDSMKGRYDGDKYESRHYNGRDRESSGERYERSRHPREDKHRNDDEYAVIVKKEPDTDDVNQQPIPTLCTSR